MVDCPIQWFRNQFIFTVTIARMLEKAQPLPTVIHPRHMIPQNYLNQRECNTRFVQVWNREYMLRVVQRLLQASCNLPRKVRKVSNHGASPFNKKMGCFCKAIFFILKTAHLLLNGEDIWQVSDSPLYKEVYMHQPSLCIFLKQSTLIGSLLTMLASLNHFVNKKKQFSKMDCLKN